MADDRTGETAGRPPGEAPAADREAAVYARDDLPCPRRDVHGPHDWSAGRESVLPTGDWRCFGIPAADPEAPVVNFGDFGVRLPEPAHTVTFAGPDGGASISLRWLEDGTLTAEYDPARLTESARAVLDAVGTIMPPPSVLAVADHMMTDAATPPGRSADEIRAAGVIRGGIEDILADWFGARHEKCAAEIVDRVVGPLIRRIAELEAFPLDHDAMHRAAREQFDRADEQRQRADDLEAIAVAMAEERAREVVLADRRWLAWHSARQRANGVRQDLHGQLADAYARIAELVNDVADRDATIAEVVAVLVEADDSADTMPPVDAVRRLVRARDALRRELDDPTGAAIVEGNEELGAALTEAREAFDAVKEESAELQRKYSQPDEPRVTRCATCNQHELVDKAKAEARALAKTARRYRRERDALREADARVRALTFASDDGAEYEHTHPPGHGEPECPACWSEDIRAALGDMGEGDR